MRGWWLLAVLPAIAGASDLYVQYTATDGSGGYEKQRLWYGDGKLYVGAAVPTDIKQAFNISTPWTRSTLLYIEPSADSSSLSPAPTLPNPTFLVANDKPGARDPVYAAHSAVGLAEDDCLFWLRYGKQAMLVERSGNAATLGYYLDDAGAEGTYVLKWRGGNERGDDAKDIEAEAEAAQAAVGGMIKQQNKRESRRSLREKNQAVEKRGVLAGKSVLFITE